MPKRFAALCAAVVACAVVPAAATAHPIEMGELSVTWTGKIGEERSWLMPGGDRDGSQAAAQAADVAPPGSANMALVGNSDKDGVTNSDLAFWGKRAYAGNYGGFRILDISSDQPRVVTDWVCNGPQNDVSVWEMGGKRFLFQSIDTPQTAEDCSSANAPLINGGTARVGYEGVRVFDITDERKPVFLDMIQTACGSHTHTLIPGKGGKAYIYVSSYPLGSNITPGDAQTPNADYRPCTVPHKKISIIKVWASGGKFRHKLKEQPLSDDTTFNRGFQACHDVQAFMDEDIALGSCAGDGQLWSIKNPWNPTTDVEGKHTHIRSPSTNDAFEFIHSGVFTWDGEYFAMMDETGGGVTANCFGDASTDGYYYFYRVVEPGDPEPPLEGRYMIPRPQGPEICVSHNATVIPVDDRYLMTAAFYQGGVTVVDFTDVSDPREVGYADLADEVGLADEWSSYWYNGRVYSNTGLNRRGQTQNRGFDVYRLTGPLANQTRDAERWKYSNPQTQEEWQEP